MVSICANRFVCVQQCDGDSTQSDVSSVMVEGMYPLYGKPHGQQDNNAPFMDGIFLGMHFKMA